MDVKLGAQIIDRWLASLMETWRRGGDEYAAAGDVMETPKSKPPTATRQILAVNRRRRAIQSADTRRLRLGGSPVRIRRSEYELAWRL